MANNVLEFSFSFAVHDRNITKTKFVVYSTRERKCNMEYVRESIACFLHVQGKAIGFIRVTLFYFIKFLIRMRENTCIRSNYERDLILCKGKYRSLGCG